MGRVCRVIGGHSHLARVELTLERDGSVCVELHCNGAGFVGQGYIEEVPLVGYDSWKAGAVEGAAFALRAVDVGDAHVIIERICGLTTDTNAATIALAAALAVWDALKAEPPAEAVSRVESEAFTSWEKPLGFVPSLH